MVAEGLAVPRGKAEEVRRLLRARGLLRGDLKVDREGETVYLPLARPVDLGYPIVERAFRPVRRGPGDYRALAEVPPDLRSLLPSSFDVVGDVAIVKLPAPLRPHGGAVGSALLRAYPRLRSVAVDAGVTGPRRVRALEVVAGPRDLRTLHREHGLTLAVDPSRAYFSPRLATERMRVARQVAPGEVVVDMFAGVGPFALTIARHARPARVYAVDANPEAFALLEENVRRNRAEGTVIPLLGDAREVVPRLGPANRVILDLPREAPSFLPTALAALRRGGTLHYYEIMPRAALRERLEALGALAREAGRPLSLEGRREVRTYSPTEAHVALDLRAD